MKNLYPKTVIFFSAFSLIIILSTACKKSVDSTPASQDSTVAVPEKKWWVSTIAGNGQKGSTDGGDSIAQFNYPAYLAIDSSEKIFVSDLQNNRIRKISDGQVTTYTGRGIVDPALGWGNIFGLAFDQQNNLYSVEYCLLRKITSPVLNDVFVGSMNVFFQDGIGNNARFNVINRITTDRQGNFYIPDYDMNLNFKIRKVSHTGVVSTITLNDNTRFYPEVV